MRHGGTCLASVAAELSKVDDKTTDDDYNDVREDDDGVIPCSQWVQQLATFELTCHMWVCLQMDDIPQRAVQPAMSSCMQNCKFENMASFD